VEEIVFDFEKQDLTYPLNSKHKPKADFSKKYPLRQRITLDLHDCNLEQAKKILQDTIQRADKKKGISLLIITGKGLNSGEKGPVIRPFTTKYLTDNSIKWRLAPPQKGGAGAVIAYL
jgi:DNA-nicking Smr family endonuclease